MAGFDTHFTTATVTGIGSIGAGYLLFHLPLEYSYLYLGMAMVGGILPDVDEPNSIPFRTFKYIGAGLGSIALLQLGVKHWSVGIGIGIGLGAYFLLLFLIGFFQSFTRHRGIFHSIPMGVFGGIGLVDIGYYLFHFPVLVSYGIGGFFLVGFFTHLLLDELYSLKIGWDKGISIKKRRSFGTAFKFKSELYPTIFLYSAIGGELFLFMAIG